MVVKNNYFWIKPTTEAGFIANGDIIEVLEIFHIKELYGFRFAEGLQLFENRIRCIPQAADDLKATAQDKLAWLDAQMAGKDYLAGDRFTMADMLLYSFTDFFVQFGQEIPAELENLTAWSARMAARPSAEA